MKKLITLSILILSGLSSFAQNIYGDMENWLNYTSDTANLERPEGWNGSDSVAYGISFPGVEPAKQIFKESSNVHGGSFAAKLVSVDISLAVIPAVITNGKIEVDVLNQTFNISGGTPVTERIDFLNAYIDYQPEGGDEASVFIRALLSGQGVNGTDSIVGEGSFTSDGTSGYEGISIHVDYIDPNVVPDKILIAFLTSEDLGGGSEGTTLYVDDVSISTTSVKNTIARTKNIVCYPNPNKGLLNISNEDNDALILNVFSTTGELVHSLSFTGSTQANLSALANGMYFYSISDASGQVIKHEKLILNK